MRHVISALVQNVPGVLAHVSGMLASRGYNIDSLAVGATENPNLSRMTFVVVGDDRSIDPRTEKLEVHASLAFANPWGHVFDAWGQNFICDASSGFNYWGVTISGEVNYPDKHPGGALAGGLTNPGSKIDPASPGVELTAPAIATGAEQTQAHVKLAADAAPGERKATLVLSYKFNNQDLKFALPLTLVISE